MDTGMGMDAQTQYAMDKWDTMMRNESRLPLDWRSGMYSGMVDYVKSYKPELAHIPTAMLDRMMFKESTYDPYAKSRTGARGIMQVDPAAVRHMWDKGRLPEAEDMSLYRPEDNILAGMTYLDYLKRRYGGSWSKILQMYNVGPGKYQQGKRNPRYSEAIIGKGG